MLDSSSPLKMGFSPFSSNFIAKRMSLYRQQGFFDSLIAPLLLFQFIQRICTHLQSTFFSYQNQKNRIAYNYYPNKILHAPIYQKLSSISQYKFMAKEEHRFEEGKNDSFAMQFNKFQMLAAAEAFQKGNTKEAISIYTTIIDNKAQNANEALLNRASAYYSSGDFDASLLDAKNYLQKEKPSVQGYILYASNLIKTKSLLSEQERELLNRGKNEYPLQKKYLDTLKVLQELQITENQEEYIDKIFEKLLSVPTLRQYMTEEPFLTKLEKMIKNPSLASALIKMDGRLSEAQDIILMADD